MRPIEIGYVAKAHGLQGELAIALHHRDSEALVPGRQLQLVRGERSLCTAIEVVRGTGKTTLVALADIADRAQAETWKGSTVFADRDELPLQDDEYYLADLVGAEVWVEQQLLGQVESIATHPSVDALVIRAPDGGLLEQPLVDEWLEAVEPEQKRVVLASRDGLIEP